MNESASRGLLSSNGGFALNHSGRPWYAFCASILLATLLIDLSAPAGISASLLYLLAVAAVGMVSGSSMHWIVAAISTGLTVVGLYGATPESIGWIELTNRAMSIGAAWVTAWIV